MYSMITSEKIQWVMKTEMFGFCMILSCPWTKACFAGIYKFVFEQPQPLFNCHCRHRQQYLFFWGFVSVPILAAVYQDFNLVGKYPAEASARVFQAGWTSLSAPPCQNWSSWPKCSEFWFNWIHVVTQLHAYSCHCSQPCGLCGPGVWCSGELCWCLVHLVVCEGRWQSFVCFVFDMRHLPRCWALLHQPNWTRLWAERAKSRDFSELYPETVPLSWTFGLGGVPGFSVVPWHVDL